MEQLKPCPFCRRFKIQPFSERFWQRGINYTPEPFDMPQR